MTWNQGRMVVDELINDGAVQRLAGADAGVADLMRRARTMLQSSAVLLASDPATAYTVAYGNMRSAGDAAVMESRAGGSASRGPSPPRSAPI